MLNNHNHNGFLVLFILSIAFATAQAQPAMLTDSRDGKTYKTVKIGNQILMAENLNYAAEGSKCYNNSADSCAKYGRLYDFETAMKSCPVGWHPSVVFKIEFSIFQK